MSANATYTISNTDRSDNSAFTVPGDEDGGAGDDSFGLEISGRSQHQRWYVHVDNGWDTDVDVTVRGSHYEDTSMADAVDDGNTVTVSSGDQAAFDGDTGHSFLEINVNPSSNPGDGDLTVRFQARD